MSKNNEGEKVKIAGFWIRFFAYLIDSLLVSVPFVLVCLIFSLQKWSEAEFTASLAVVILFYLLLKSLLLTFYNVFTTSFWGASLGKKAFGLEVVTEEGERLKVSESLLRFVIGYAVSSLVFGLGFLWILKDKENKAWHDMIVGTQVIIKGKNIVSGTVFFISLSVFVAILLIRITVGLIVVFP